VSISFDGFAKALEDAGDAAAYAGHCFRFVLVLECMRMRARFARKRKLGGTRNHKGGRL